MLTIIDKLIEFFKHSYRTDKFAFWLEMWSAILVITGSTILTFTVLDPKPELFIPFYWLGALLGLWGAYRRTLPWIMLLTGYFTIMNSIALWKLFS